MTRAFGWLLAAPFAGFVLEAALGAGGFELSARAWGQTLIVAGGAALLSLAIGVPGGLVLAHTRSRAPLALTLLPLLVAPALAASAWMGLHLPLPGAIGCAIILACVSWPVVALLLYAALTRIPRAALEAAELDLSPGRLIRRVVWPETRPAILAGGLLVFLLAASDFTVSSTFAVPTISYVIFERLSAFRYGTAALAAIPLLALAVGLAMVVRRVPVLPAAGGSRPFLRGTPLALAWAVAGAAWLVTVILPAATWIATVRNAGRALATNAESILWSVSVSGSAALIVVLWASFSPRRSRLEPLWLASLVLPGIALALGALGLASRLGVQTLLMEEGFLLVLVLMARFAYAAWVPLRDAVNPAELEAAELAGFSRWRTWWRVSFPALRPRAFAAAAIVFALALGEIGPAVLLSPAGRQTVAQHLFNLMHFGYDETVAALALVLFAIAALIVGVGTNVGLFHRAPVAR